MWYHSSLLTHYYTMRRCSSVVSRADVERAAAMLRTLALILAGGESRALSALTAERSEAAVPFAGKYRIIDFALSNCVNSGIYDVAVLTQYEPQSLKTHIGVGKPWDLDRLQGGVRLLQPYVGRQESGWQKGTADAVYRNLDFIM